MDAAGLGHPGRRSAGALRVREARIEDVEELARVHVASWHDAYRGIIAARNLARTTVARSEARFRGYFWQGGQDWSTLHVLEGEGRIVGYANAGLSNSRSLGVRGEVFELYLAPEVQGRGAGRMLFGASMWGLAHRRLLPVVVWALADNHRARRFYEGRRGRPLATGKTKVGDEILAKVAYGWHDYLPWPEHLLR